MADLDPEYGVLYRGARHTIQFRILLDGEAYDCGITQEALNDCLQTPDTRAQAEANFSEFEDDIVAGAARLVATGNVDDEGRFMLTHAFCRPWLMRKTL